MTSRPRCWPTRPTRGLAEFGREVGYGSASAFVAAFRLAVGVTPGAYFQS